MLNDQLLSFNLFGSPGHVIKITVYVKPTVDEGSKITVSDVIIDACYKPIGKLCMH